MRVLVTGGAGFIGSHVCDELLAHGHQVTALDPLHPQVHPDRERPAYLDDEVELRRADIRDPYGVGYALDRTDAVIHLAARVGVGQSMYEAPDYVAANSFGTSVLLDAMTQREMHKLVVASSMSIYGEGLALTSTGESVWPGPRPTYRLAAGEWEPCLPGDDRSLAPVPTSEFKPPEPASVYALTKYDQEVLCLTMGAAHGIPTLALRLFNVYGPRQALSNPYTGALAIFAAQLLNGHRPYVYENGLQLRDFIEVHDVARAFRLAVESPLANEAINIATGRPTTVLYAAHSLAQILALDAPPVVSSTYRIGDIRHCYADVEKAQLLLEFTADVSFDEGLPEYVDWLQNQQADDRTAAAIAELAHRGLALPAHADNPASR